jgi:hypothetical protein
VNQRFRQEEMAVEDVDASTAGEIDVSVELMERMPKTAKRLEQRYIELLEAKITSLETEIKLYRDEEKATTKHSVSIILLNQYSYLSPVLLKQFSHSLASTSR